MLIATDAIAESPLYELPALSAFGTKLCFCKAKHNQFMEPFIEIDPKRTTEELVPQKFWDCDILEEEGLKRFKSMVEEIKQACAAL
jgi:hypothetical protein